ncbi:D-2-hydroxyacid dehydrogenase [Alkalicoccus daliensis]|uniref:Phosphoglycerate dehydrogenase n=1 Tax=Alkalicoccus daliensis TaxID=745820 RepID=A0A1H0DLW0_9BACI|nr:D-2-hydroxyacid dehydrogenase [Alkalicoccus daliensis]SDN71049.1 Phosphoglycerate dehydrogenase [Alkalicoccus daliensis]
MIVVSTGNIAYSITKNFTEKFSDVDFRWYKNIEEAEESLYEAEAIITYGEDLTEDHIYKAENLRWIMVVSAGMDEMPFQAIAEKHILVTNARGIHAVPMGEYAIHMMLHTARQMQVVQEQEKEHKWDRSPVMTELHGKTLAVIGAGAIGAEVARLSNAFHMYTIGVNKSGRNVDPFCEISTIENLHDVLGKADFVVSVLPKMKATNNIFSRDAFKSMNSEAVFINMGRGNVVDEQALLRALDVQELKHAVLDVFNEEPLPPEHPFWSHKKITVTPHLSGISPQYQPRAMEIFHHNLQVYRSGKGEYINKVDPSKGY